MREQHVGQITVLVESSCMSTFTSTIALLALMSEMLDTRGDTAPSECKHCRIRLLIVLGLPCLVLCDLHIHVVADSFCSALRML